MSTIVSSSAAPAPLVSASHRSPARTDEPDQGVSGSFGEVLARSRQPAADKPAVKAAALVREPADPEKTETQDLVNPMAALLIPFENRTGAAALPGGSGLSDGEAVAQTDAGLAHALAKKPLAAGVLEVTPDTAGLTAAALPDGSSPSGAKAVAQTDDALANTLAKTPLMAGAPEVATESARLAALALAPAADPYRVSRTPAQARQASMGDGAVTGAAPRTMAGQTGAANADLSDLFLASAQEDTAADKAGDEGAGLALLAADATTGASGTQWLLQPAGAALQATAGASAPNPPAPGNPATALLTPQVGSSEWGKALGQQVIHMGKAGNPVAELQLNPPGLGPLKVTLSMVDQQMQAVFVSAHSSVRAAVEAALPQLRTLLAESGISLGNTSVGSESQQQTAFSNGQNGQNNRLPREIYRNAEADATALFSARLTAEPVGRGSSLRIDTYA